MHIPVACPPWRGSGPRRIDHYHSVDRVAKGSASLLARRLRDSRRSFTGRVDVLDRCFRVVAVVPVAAEEHAASTEQLGHRHSVMVRADVQYGLLFVLDLPLPLQFDCRSCRCLTCLRNGVSKSWSVSCDDIHAKFPEVLRCRAALTESISSREVSLSGRRKSLQIG
jgi:hypothetical protein